MKIKYLTILILAAISLIACKKAPEIPVVTVQLSNEVVTSYTRTVTITSNYSYPTELKDVIVIVSKNEDMSDAVTQKATTTASTIEVTITGLEGETTYYYCFEYKSGGVSSKSSLKSFKTLDYSKPTVTTSEVTEITATSAKCGGNVFDDGGFYVTARGVCWSKSQSPTISNSHTSDGSGLGNFTSLLTNLEMGTTYYVRAYATNSMGTNYGDLKSFKTPPIGSISGIFSVSDVKQVYFSQGNLQYQASTNTWRFAEHQYDYVGDANSNISPSYSGWIDLFGWGTSGQNTGAIAYQPYSTSTNNTDYYPEGSATSNLTCANKADWGYNAISNGGNTTMQWRTLSGGEDGEWNYLWNSRVDASSKHGYARINDINGIVLLPDNWTQPSGVSFIPDILDFNTNTYSVSDWIIMENNGAVFLPAAGCRSDTSISNVDSYGHYWSNSYNNSNYAFFLYFYSGNVYTSSGGNRYGGRCVRLVQDL